MPVSSPCDEEKVNSCEGSWYHWLGNIALLNLQCSPQNIKEANWTFLYNFTVWNGESNSYNYILIKCLYWFNKLVLQKVCFVKIQSMNFFIFFGLVKSVSWKVLDNILNFNFKHYFLRWAIFGIEALTEL